MRGKKITKVVVTGGLGFIGSNFTRLLARQHRARITILDNLSYGSNQSILEELNTNSHCNFVKGDITSQQAVKKIIDGVDAFVNFAAETHVDRSISNTEEFIRANFLGVYSILEAMRQARNEVRFIQVGTDEEYGDILRGSFTEEDRLRPSSPYAASKAAASMLIQAYHRTYGLETVVTRCTNNFGPYQFPEKLIPKAIIRAILGLKIPIYGKGTNVRDWIYVEDHCRAIDRVLHAGRAGEVYNVSSNEELENRQVVSEILETLGKPRTMIEYVEDRPGHDYRYSLDSSKMRNELGWKPTHTFRRALTETVNWYLKNENWWRPLARKKVLHPSPWKLRW